MKIIYKFIKKCYYRIKLIIDVVGKIFYLAPNNSDVSKDYLNSIDIHCIEKGLGMPNVRLGFGKAHIKNIVNYIKESKDKNSYNYKYSLSVLKAYIDFHKEQNYNISDVEKCYTEINGTKEPFYKAGVETYAKNTIYSTFEDFISSRHSVRKFKKELVNENILNKAFSMNQTVPSACNRQTTKVYYSMNPKINKQIGELLPGNNGFRECISQYLVITGDISAFRYDEYGQWYTNVGIYAYGLTLCLQALNVDSCMLQWTTNKQKEKVLKRLLFIPKAEDVVLALAIGYRSDDAKFLISKRKDINDIIYKVDNI